MKQLRAASIGLTVLLLIVFTLGFFFIPKRGRVNSDAPTPVADPTQKPCAPRVYPPESLQAREQGIAWVKYTTGPDGAVVTAEIMQSSGYARLDAASLQHVKTCKFRSDVHGGTLLEKWFLH